MNPSTCENPKLALDSQNEGRGKSMSIEILAICRFHLTFFSGVCCIYAP